MEKKKKLAIGIISIIIVAAIVVTLIPVFIYGAGVSALSFDMGLGLSGAPSTSDSYETNDFGSSSLLTVNIVQIDVNPYEYFFRQFQGEATATGNQEVEVLSIYIDLVIYINITTPSAETYELSYTLQDLLNMFDSAVNVLLGPDEIDIETGTYSISVALEVFISIPEFPPSGYEESFYFGPYSFNVDVEVEE